MGSRKERIDVVMAKKGIVQSREKAKELIAMGKVKVEGKTVTKPSEKVDEDAEIEVNSEKYVSRGYLKIKKAWEDLRFSVNGRVCVDVGASTGGFTQFLVEKGAKLVYAVDIGRGLLATQLRANPKVIVMEGVDGRKLEPGMFDPKPDFATVDVSFTSAVPIIRALEFVPEVLVLIKPNFELPKRYLKKGVLKEIKYSKPAVLKVVEQVKDIFRIVGITYSWPPGSSGNPEFFALFKKDVEKYLKPDELSAKLDELIEKLEKKLEGYKGE